MMDRNLDKKLEDVMKISKNCASLEIVKKVSGHSNVHRHLFLVITAGSHWFSPHAVVKPSSDCHFVFIAQPMRLKSFFTLVVMSTLCNYQKCGIVHLKVRSSVDNLLYQN